MNGSSIPDFLVFLSFHTASVVSGHIMLTKVAKLWLYTQASCIILDSLLPTQSADSNPVIVVWPVEPAIIPSDEPYARWRVLN